MPREYLSIAIILFLALPVTGIKAQVAAAFGSDTTQGCSPLVIRFRDQSTGSPVYWRWDLGNGTVSFNQNPSTTYFTAGKYTIKLFVRNAANQEDSIVKNEYITAYAPPVLNFRGSDTAGCFPLNVRFTDLSSPGSGTISSWEWDFGDGFTSHDANPVHTYTALGNYNVSLRIINSNGCVTTLSKPQYIRIANGATAGFSFTAPNSCRPPTSISFTNASTGTGTLSYSWSFGDGGTSTQANPAHSYTATGSYNVRLIVQNNAGCRDTLEKPNAITIGGVAADFSSPAQVCAGVALPLVNTSSPAPSGALWTFSDGSTAATLNPVKAFTNPGNYTIKLVSDFGACKDSVTKPVTVLPKPAAAFSAVNNLSCKPPLTVSFTSNAVNAVSYKWIFGDGSTSSQQNPVHLYQQGGRYDVTLVVTGANGCTDSLRQPGFVQIVPADVTVTNLSAQGCAPLSFTPVTSVRSVEPVTGWLWDFGDGTTATEATPTHVYQQAGVFTVKLFFTTRGGCRDSITYKDGVMVGNPPQVNFSAIPQNTCAFDPVRFTDLTVGDPLTEWYWEFGDRSTSLEQNPVHNYSDTGYFTVKLTVSSNGCKTDHIVKDYVYIKPPIAIFTDSSNCINPLSRRFFDFSLGATSWSWNFGDSTTSTERNPVHTYPKAGPYVVTLTVRNDSCINIAERQVLIIAEKADFAATDTAVCKGSPVLFQTRNIDKKNISLQVWDFGDGSTSGATDSVAHRYSTNGLFSVKLFIRDVNGCTDTLSRRQYISVHGPTAGFSASVKIVCVRAAVDFNDLSVADSTAPIRQWTWTWGDGLGDSLTGGPFRHTYTAGGNYTVQLKVTDNQGCTDSISKPGSVFIAQPLARFLSPDSLSCFNKPIRFINQSAGQSLSQTWDFGDASPVSTLFQPTHSYPNEGSYTISLAVKDQYGCQDTVTRQQYIRIRNPRAAFSVNDSVATCPPLVTRFTNQSLNFTGYEWDFGDGTRSTVDNPTHFYNTSGTFIAKLVITSPGGCKDSTTRRIVVRGPQGDLTYENTTACLPLTMQFKATTKDNLSFLWDFNDGTTVASADSTISHTFTLPGSYLPKVILIDPQGCKVPVEGKDTIHVLGVTADFRADHLTVCDSGKVQFTDASKSNDSIVSYQWSFGEGGVSAQRNPVHFYTNPGTFPVRLTVTTLHGCTDSLDKKTDLVIVPSPVTGIRGDLEGCAPARIGLQGVVLKPDTAALQWQWNYGNGQTGNQQDPGLITYTQAGTYTVSLVTSNRAGCADTSRQTVVIHPAPLVDAGANATICKGGFYQLTGLHADKYRWSPAAPLSCEDCPSPVARPDATTVFRLQGETIFGCKGEDSVIIEVKQPFKLSASLGDTLCTGNSLTLFATGAELYTWTPSAGLDNPNAQRPKASPVVTTNYRVIGTDTKNCFSDTAYVPVVVYPYPTVDAGEDKTISVGNSISLAPKISSDVTSIKWQPVTGLSCVTCSAPVAAPKQTTTYRITVSNEGTCAAQDEMTVFVVCREGNLFMPNTFSPNGDGNNDVFYPRGKGIYGVRSLKIFNRWGESVYEKYNFPANDASPNAGWNGTYKGRDASQDVYVYIIEIVCENNTVILYKGNVTLIR